MDRFACVQKEIERLDAVITSSALNQSGFGGILDALKTAATQLQEEKNGVEKIVKRKIFPGYVLVKMIVTDDSWFVVRNVRGVTGFVGPSGSPVPLTEAEVASLGVETHSVEVTYAVGDTVEIIYGALEGFSGKVEAVDTEKGIVTVVLSMLGRDTSVELELDQVELAD